MNDDDVREKMIEYLMEQNAQLLNIVANIYCPISREPTPESIEEDIRQLKQSSRLPGGVL